MIRKKEKSERVPLMSKLNTRLQLPQDPSLDTTSRIRHRRVSADAITRIESYRSTPLLVDQLPLKSILPEKLATFRRCSAIE